MVLCLLSVRTIYISIVLWINFTKFLSANHFNITVNERSESDIVSSSYNGFVSQKSILLCIRSNDARSLSAEQPKE